LVFDIHVLLFSAYFRQEAEDIEDDATEARWQEFRTMYQIGDETLAKRDAGVVGSLGPWKTREITEVQLLFS